ncbi:MAG TPA: thioredoxin-disulfide reductase [Bacteroidales bacterium]|nr:thioredoxin-disulfide reductase [Bacteroidales bacterium]HOH22735.1 thioredoxin-disulfide reductase [Bacteroidales bacterium]HPZ03073.1 thioredoxin-disulfide reductase [Bacteroidales bacterium]HQB74695.1 thioredoxin-disulfide reductase [Bacteroidales bacterium]
MEKTKCLIIGGGVAGYTAAIYATRSGLEPILYEGSQPGGQLTITTDVENFPGYPEGEQGPVIMEQIKQQALNVGADIRSGEITEVDFSNRPFRCVVDYDHQIEAETVIVATGATARWLGIESEKTYRGFGVSACATCDGTFFKNKVVAVIGGGDTALEEASYLAKLCSKVYLVHRRDQFRASQAMQDKVTQMPNIELLLNYVPKEILGEQKGFIKQVNGLLLTNTKDQSEKKVDLDGVFIAIGVIPMSDLFKGQLELDAQGYIKTDGVRPLTNVPGVFAAGDIQDPIYRQAITAAASGCKAAIEAERFLNQ